MAFSYASCRFLNAVLYAFNDPTINTNNKLTTQLDENLLSLIQRTVTSKSGVGNVNRIGFKITFNGGANPSHTYFVKYNQSTQITIYIQNSVKTIEMYLK